MLSLLQIASVAWLILISGVPRAWAGNEHEHLVYLPAYQDIERASLGRLGKTPSKQLVGSLSSPVCQMIGPEWLKKVFPDAVIGLTDKPENVYNKAMQNLINESDFDQLASRLARAHPDKSVQPSEVKKMFFEISALTPHREGYLMATAVRTNLFQTDADLMIRSLENIIDRLPQSESNKIVASIPQQIENEPFLRKLYDFFSRKGIQGHLYSSVPRSHLLKSTETVQARLEMIESLQKKGLIQGLDISGSIAEANHREMVEAKVKTYNGNLERMFEFSHKTKMPMRVHAFEGASIGPFYNSFWKTFEQCVEQSCLPPVLRIGHIQALDESDIKRLKTYSKRVPIIFEANIESNLSLQSEAKLSKLVKTIELIHEYKLPVALGADGLGILGEQSSFEKSMMRLKNAGLSAESLDRLLKEGFNPVAPLERKVLKTWLAERTRVRGVVFAQVKSMAKLSLASSCAPGVVKNFLMRISGPELKP